MAEISILSNARIAGALQFDKDFSEFPANPKVGTLLIKNQCLYGYIKIGTFETWYPFAARTSSYIHSQGGASTSWTITHNLNSTDVWYQVKDSNGDIVSPADFNIIDRNTVQIIFTEALTGTAVLVSTSTMDIPSLKATLIEIGSTVRIDTAGMTINGDRVLTRAVMTIGDGTDAKFSVSDLQRLNFVGGTGVDVSFDDATKSITFDAPGLSVTPEWVQTNVKGSVPGTLDTLEKLAASINNDATYSLTVSTNLGLKLDKSEVVTVATPNKVLRLDGSGKLAASITGNAATATNVDWTGVLNKPTTLSGFGITDAMPLAGDPNATLTIKNINISGTLLPTGPSGTLDIGSPTQRFGTIYVDEAKLSTNTLYIGDTPILGTSMDTIMIKADPNQSINISTRGTGSTLMTSEKSVSIQTTGMNADVVIQASGNGSKVRFGASQTIEFTAPESVLYGNTSVSGNHSVGGNLLVTGNLTVNGQQTIINAATVTTKDNIIVVNSGEVGSGVTSGKAGIQVDRGDEADYQIIFDETDDLFKVGMVGQLEVIASRPWVSAGFSAVGHGHADANASSSGFMSAANFTKLAAVEANANNYVHPSTDGSLHVPATGTTNSKKVLTAGSTAGSLSWSFVDWADIANKPSTFTPSAHTHADGELTSISWSKVINRATTLSGYGITDAVNMSDVVTTATPNKILKLDGSGRLVASVTGDLNGNASTATKLETARTVSLSGDATGSVSFDGSANANIAVTLANVVAGATATKVTFNDKGQITGSAALAAADIPALDWSKIATGKPTTVAGYGITNAVTTDGNSLPVANGAISSSNTVVAAKSNATAIDAVPAAQFRTVKYLVQAVSGANLHSTELMVIHDGTTAYATEYASLMTTTLFSLEVAVSNGNLVLTATSVYDNTTYKVIRTAVGA